MSCYACAPARLVTLVAAWAETLAVLALAVCVHFKL